MSCFPHCQQDCFSLLKNVPNTQIVLLKGNVIFLVLFSISGILILSSQNRDRLEAFTTRKAGQDSLIAAEQMPPAGLANERNLSVQTFYPVFVSIHILISCKCTTRASNPPPPLPPPPTGAQRASSNPSLSLSSRRGCQLACRAAAWGCSGVAWAACRDFFFAPPAGQHVIWICLSKKKTKQKEPKQKQKPARLTFALLLRETPGLGAAITVRN